MNGSAQVTVETLLSHTDWLRGFVARLVRDPNEADDVVQDVLASATTAERHPREIRSWLAGAARKSATMLARTTGRRHRHETRAAAARTETADPAVEVAARAEQQRMLIERIEALSPKLREVVLLRFFDGRKPKAIAATLGIPVATVRSRLELALEKLRVDLDRKFGGRRAWVAMLLPLTNLRDQAATATIAQLLRRPATIAFACGICAVISIGWWTLIRDSLPDFREAGPITSALGTLEPIDANSAAPGPERELVDTAGRSDLWCNGIVVDLQGEPIEGATVRPHFDWVFEMRIENGELDPKVWQVMTDSDGRFRLPWFAGGIMDLGAPSHPNYLPELHRTEWKRGDDVRVEMRRRYPSTLEVEVVERRTGRPVPYFRVSTSTDWPMSGNVVYIPDDRRDRITQLSSVASTNGRLGPMPFDLVKGVATRIWVTVAGSSVDAQVSRVLEPADQGEVLFERFEVDLDLPESEPSARIALGTVVADSDGHPLAGVTIRATQSDDDDRESYARSVQTREDGAYRVALPRVGAVDLAASAPGYESVTLKDVTPDAPQAIRLVRRGSLRVTVLDSNRQPLRGAHALFRTWKGEHHERVQTDDNGQLEFGQLAANRYYLYLVPDSRAPDEEALASTSFVVKPGIDLNVTFEVDPPDRVLVSGTLSPRIDDDTPLLPVFVPYRGNGGWARGRRVGSVGFTAGGLERGDYLVVIAPANDDDRDAIRAFLPKLTVDETASQVFRLEVPRGEVRGSIVSPEATPPLRVVAIPKLPSDAEVLRPLLESARFIDTFARPVNTQDRSFVVPYLAAGDYELQLRTQNRVVASRDVHVDEGGIVDVGTWVVD